MATDERATDTARTESHPVPGGPAESHPVPGGPAESHPVPGGPAESHPVPGGPVEADAVISLRPMRADARRNHALLVNAARDAFTEQGPEAPLDDIARRAGVGPGTLYRHFPTRDALLAAVYRGDVEEMATRAYRLGEEHSPDEALTAWLGLQLEYTKHKRGLGAAIKTMLGADSETLNFCRDTMRGALASLLRRAQEAGAVRTDVDAADVLRLVHGVGMASESAPEDADRLLSYVIDGLRPPTR